MNRFRVFLIAASLVLSSAAAQNLNYVFGLTFDGGGWFDASFNEATWAGLTRALDDLSGDYDIDLLIFNGLPDTSERGQARLAALGADLLVAAGFLQAEAVQNVSNQYPATSFLLIDAVAENPNVRSVLFREHEGSFLVGYLAGKLSQTGYIGFVGGMDVSLIRAFDLGFQRGVEQACPQCVVFSDYVGTTPSAWNDPPKARELAASQQARGADIIYAAAGASGTGVIDYVNQTMCFDPSPLTPRRTPLSEQVASMSKSPQYNAQCAGKQPLFFIGVDSNQNFMGDTDNNPTTLNHGLTSMLKRVDVAAERAALDVVNGRFTAGIQNLGLAENGVGYAVDQYNQALIPQSLIDEVERVKSSIISGTLVVPDYREMNP